VADQVRAHGAAGSGREIAGVVVVVVVSVLVCARDMLCSTRHASRGEVNLDCIAPTVTVPWTVRKLPVWLPHGSPQQLHCPM